MNGQNRADVKIGARVKIVLKADQRTGKLTEGVVGRLLTKVPMHYEYQCRFYMGVRDLPFWDIACMWGNGENDFPIRRIYRDMAIEELIFETIAAFIKSIHDNKPPDMSEVAPELAMKSLARIYGASTVAAPTIEFGKKHERQIKRIASLQGT